MVIGVLTLELDIASAMSLKDKRRVLARVKQRVRNKFNVSIAEVDANEILNFACLGVVIACNEQKFANRVLDKIVTLVETIKDCVLADYEIQFLRVG